MSDIRFAWSRVPKLEACLELKKRNIHWPLYKDSKFICLVCGKKPHAKDDCYYPSTNVSTTTNKTIGHKSCVDRFVLEADGKAAATSAKPSNGNGMPVPSHMYADGAARSRKLEQTISRPNHLPPASLDELKASVAQLKEKVKLRVVENTYEKGYTAGYRAAWEEIQEALGNE